VLLLGLFGGSTGRVSFDALDAVAGLASGAVAFAAVGENLAVAVPKPPAELAGRILEDFERCLPDFERVGIRGVFRDSFGGLVGLAS